MARRTRQRNFFAKVASLLTKNVFSDENTKQMVLSACSLCDRTRREARKKKKKKNVFSFFSVDDDHCDVFRFDSYVKIT